MPWKEISQLTDLNQKNLDELLENTEASKQLQNSDVRRIKLKIFRSKKLKGVIYPFKLLPPPPPKRQRKQVALRTQIFYGPK
jgi:hypothetical protein